MNKPKFYSYPFEKLPDSPGLYAFYLDLKMFKRYAELARDQGFDQVDLSAPFQKAIRSATLTQQTGTRINLYGKSWCNYVSLTSDHTVKLDLQDARADQNTFDRFSAVIASCFLLSAPLYIGITTRTFGIRLDEHRDKYKTLVEEKERGKISPYAPEGEFYEQLYRRDLTFRELTLVCVPVHDTEQEKILRLVERFLQSTSNPPLSISH